MQPKTSKSKNNGCGTAPGNLVIVIIGIIDKYRYQYIGSDMPDICR